jgi:hypothetical protein
MIVTRPTATAVIALLLSVGPAYAQSSAGTGMTPIDRVELQRALARSALVREADPAVWPLSPRHYSAEILQSRLRPFAFQASSSGGRQRSTGRKVLGGILGGVGGFFGGGFLGAAIEGDRCECDDPGFVGFLIGAPTGAVIGTIVGVKFF